MKVHDTAKLQEELGHRFLRTELLEQALTHTSHARELESARSQESPSDPAFVAGDNEQLEFLGDAVLGLVTTEELCRRFPHFREGNLSKLRAHLVSEKHLIRVAKDLQLGTYLRLGRGEEKSGGRNKTAMLVDALEALLAALYLDAGLETARGFIVDKIILPEVSTMVGGGDAMPLTDYKSALQEKLQAESHMQPVYSLVRQHGPEHSKTFTVEVRLQPLGGEQADFVGRAEGTTKKNAEQDAARQVLEYLQSRPERPSTTMRKAKS
ncbi:MAG: ribonuclease III [Terriglobales bacterium]